MAIAFVAESSNQSSATSFTIALGHTVAANNLIVVMIAYVNGVTVQNSPTISDNVNTGNYSAPSSLSFFHSATSTQMTYAYKVCNASGTPTITISGMNGVSFVAAEAALYSGFVNTPTLVTADITCNFGTGTSAAGTTFSNSNANEVIVGYIGCGTTTASAYTGTVSNQRNTGNPNDEFLDVIKATSGNTISLGCTLSPSVNWAVMLAGFYDAPAILFIQSAGIAPGSATTSLAINFGANVTAGDCLFCCVNSINTMASISDNLNGSWLTADVQQDGIGPLTGIFKLANSLGGACTITVSLGASVTASAWIGEVRGLAPTYPLDQIAQNAATGTAVTSTASGTTQQAVEFVLVATGNNSGATATVGAGYTLDTNSNSGIAVEYQSTSAKAAMTGTMTLSASVAYSCVLATYGIVNIPPLIATQPNISPGIGGPT